MFKMFKMFKKKSTYIVIGILILVVAGVWYGSAQSAKKKQTQMVSSLVTVSSGNIIDQVTGTGVISANETMSITSLVGGMVVSAPFEDGETVQAGDLLYTIDTKNLEQQIRAAKIAVERAEESYNQSVAAGKDLTVTSLYSGKVQTLYVSKGDFVNSGMKIADVIDNTSLLLKIPFNSSDMDKIQMGAAADITLTSNLSALRGSVSRIYDTIESLGGYRAVRYIEISVVNPGAIGKGEKAYATVNGIGCNSAGEFINQAEKSIVSSGSGQIATLNIAQGDVVNKGATVALLKNDSITNAISNGALMVKDAKNALASLTEKLSDFRITAPISGKVITKTVKKGDNAVPAVPMTTISDIGSLYIDTEIDEVYISKIMIGQKAHVTAEALPGKMFEGEVIRINDAGIAKNGVTYYLVRIKLQPDDRLLIAMNTSVDIIVGEKRDAVLVPKASVAGDKVKLFADGVLKEQTVEIGIKDSEHIEIVNGLNKGDQIAGKWGE